MRIRQVTRASRQSGRSRALRAKAATAQASAPGQGWQPSSWQEQSGIWQPWLGGRPDEHDLQSALPRRRRSSSAGNRLGDDGVLTQTSVASELEGSAVSGASLAALLEEERAQRVAMLRARVVAGTYEVDSVTLARRMLEEVNRDG
ncbi:flagellar biosynthesis anti-sigma factor FlgM [Thermogemmatispora sp.]|uniref:flagellar biosynthesis anti-sigma factor FlgM n=1 Tax=Thermogemmatispora sp. TaxID=1968838 RepID=UPI003A0FEDAB